jgi:hypothetical protein
MICPAYYCDVAHQDVNIKAEVFSDGDEEKPTVLTSYPEMKTKPEVCCASVKCISQIRLSHI